MTFTHYIGVDYSSQDRKQKTWVAVGRRTFMGFDLIRLESIGRDGLPDLLREYASSRVLLTVDFPFSWPVDFIANLMGEPPRSWLSMAEEVQQNWTMKKIEKKRDPFVRKNDITLRLTDSYLKTTSPLQNTYPDLMTMVWYGMKTLVNRPPTYRVLPFERLEPSHSLILEVAPEVTLEKLGIAHTLYHGESQNTIDRRKDILRQLCRRDQERRRPRRHHLRPHRHLLQRRRQHPRREAGRARPERDASGITRRLDLLPDTCLTDPGRSFRQFRSSTSSKSVRHHE